MNNSRLSVNLVNLRTMCAQHTKNVNQKMFDRCGPLMTDLAGVHGRDPHLPAVPAHLPLFLHRPV